MMVLGIDPALGGGEGMVAADLGENLTIVDARVDYNLSRTEEQLELIGSFVVKYRPSVVIVEFDSQQKGLGNDERLRALGHRHGFTIRPHLTRNKKMDEVFGVASMDQSFRKGEIRIPYKTQDDKDRMGPLLAQLRAWRPDIATKHLTQDLVMALWFCHLYWFETKRKHVPDPAPSWRPTWLREPAYMGRST
jgi:hypothetical protein